MNQPNAQESLKRAKGNDGPVVTKQSQDKGGKAGSTSKQQAQQQDIFGNSNSQANKLVSSPNKSAPAKVGLGGSLSGISSEN